MYYRRELVDYCFSVCDMAAITNIAVVVVLVTLACCVFQAQGCRTRPKPGECRTRGCSCGYKIGGCCEGLKCDRIIYETFVGNVCGSRVNNVGDAKLKESEILNDIEELLNKW